MKENELILKLLIISLKWSSVLNEHPVGSPEVESAPYKQGEKLRYGTMAIVISGRCTPSQLTP